MELTAVNFLTFRPGERGLPAECPPGVKRCRMPRAPEVNPRKAEHQEQGEYCAAMVEASGFRGRSSWRGGLAELAESRAVGGLDMRPHCGFGPGAVAVGNGGDDRPMLGDGFLGALHFIQRRRAEDK